MSAYLLLDLLFLTPCVILYAAAWRLRPPRHVRALLATLLTLFVLTVVFDSLMIAAGLFTYAEDKISGVRLWLAPIEDLAYPLAAALLGAALWDLRRGGRGMTPTAPEGGAAATGGASAPVGERSR